MWKGIYGLQNPDKSHLQWKQTADIPILKQQERTLREIRWFWLKMDMNTKCGMRQKQKMERSASLMKESWIQSRRLR